MTKKIGGWAIPVSLGIWFGIWLYGWLEPERAKQRRQMRECNWRTEDYVEALTEQAA